MVLTDEKKLQQKSKAERKQNLADATDIYWTFLIYITEIVPGLFFSLLLFGFGFVFFFINRVWFFSVASFDVFMWFLKVIWG